MAVSPITVINGSGNVGTDYTILADEIGSGKIQLVKLDLGGVGASSPATTNVPVSAVSLPLPTGAATAALQLADNHQVTVSNTSLTVVSTPLALRYDEGATYTYIGEAAAGTATSAASWRIKRLTNADNTIVWADGNTNQDNIWDNRAALSYS